mmetsp:Transcript_38750/g.97612  ORF Transcript_38750/g.97612 Transcript_38750/m.97612 type:complete len:213 (-) Transcript_38750:2216-2854(-)
MTFTLSKANYLGLERRTIARANTKTVLAWNRELGRLVNILSYDIIGDSIGPESIAWQLAVSMRNGIIQKGERKWFHISRLYFERTKVDAGTMKSRRSASLHSGQRKTIATQTTRQSMRSGITETTGRNLLSAEQDHPTQEGTSGYDHSRCLELCSLDGAALRELVRVPLVSVAAGRDTDATHGADHAFFLARLTFVHQEVVDGRLNDGETWQ